MGGHRTKVAIVLVLCLFSLPVFLEPPAPNMAGSTIFDDPALSEIERSSSDDTIGKNLLVRIQHEDSGPLTSNFSRVMTLMDIERGALGGNDSTYSFDSPKVFIHRLETPFSSWESAFQDSNTSMEDASSWGDVLQPENEDGWCGQDATDSERSALQATLLLLPKQSNLGVACPQYAGASASQPPQSNELLWLVWLDSEEKPVDWSELISWCDKLTANSDYVFEPAGINVLFEEASLIATEDLSFIVPAGFALLVVFLCIFLRGVKIASITLGSVGLVLIAETGLLVALGQTLSVIDAIAIPIIMGVAVDGAFWYTSSTKSREDVRKMMFLAMCTTVAAVSLAMISEIKLQRNLALVIVLGIVMDYIMTRYVLEDVYMDARKQFELNPDRVQTTLNVGWVWPTLLLILAGVAASAPVGVEILDIHQFMPEEHPSLDELEELREKYVIASSTIAYIVIDINSQDTASLQALSLFYTNLAQHPSIIAYDTGLTQHRMVLGLPSSAPSEGDDIDRYIEDNPPSLLMSDSRLSDGSGTTGVIVLAVVDGEDADAAFSFSEDVDGLLDVHGLQGEVGGDLVTGIKAAKSFEDTRILQIALAGAMIFVVAWAVTGSRQQGLQIAVGSVAVGISVDGLASFLGGRGVSTAPAVLLGMGFAADYLSHASEPHPVTRSDFSARWKAAITSAALFVLISFSEFPPAKDTGQLLTSAIFVSVVLATALSFSFLSESTKIDRPVHNLAPPPQEE